MSKIIQMFPDKKYLVWLIDGMLLEIKDKFIFKVSQQEYTANGLFILQDGRKIFYEEYEFESYDDFFDFLMCAKIRCSRSNSWGSISVSLMALVSCYVSYLGGSTNRTISNKKTHDKREIVFNSELSNIVTGLFEILFDYKNMDGHFVQEIYARLILLINQYIDECNSCGVIR